LDGSSSRSLKLCTRPAETPHAARRSYTAFVQPLCELRRDDAGLDEPGLVRKRDELRAVARVQLPEGG
jgi:hypothetical protein